MSENNEGSAFLGKGWSFPPQFQSGSKEVEMVGHEDDIKESLNILLSTSPGERIMQPKFGCDIKKMVFETLGANNITLLKDAIEKAILFFEPRIDLVSIDIETNDDPEVVDNLYNGMLNIFIDYTVRLTNTRSNIVYPFYILEGSDVRM